MSIFQENKYDIIVCGAGPAGLMAAATLSKLLKNSKKILLLDKKTPWKEPIFCAEAVSTHQLNRMWPINAEWVREGISGIYFTSPEGHRAEFYSKDCGSLLNRSLLHREMAETCEKQGVECFFNAFIKNLKRTTDGAWALEVLVDGVLETVLSPVVVDATGPGCRLTRDIPELKGLVAGDCDLEPAIFAIAEGIAHSKEHIELFFGSEFPNGYGWIFPRDGKEVNVGFVLGSDVKTDEPLRKKLEQWIAKKYPAAKIKGVYGGKIACTGKENKPLAKWGLFKVGDAASCVNPISRSGIVESIETGKIAAESIVEWFAAESEMRRSEIESEVLNRWLKMRGNSHKQLAKGKRAFNSIPDRVFDKAAKELSKLPREKQTLFRIFFTVLKTSPTLIWKMRSFIC